MQAFFSDESATRENGVFPNRSATLHLEIIFLGDFADLITLVGLSGSNMANSYLDDFGIMGKCGKRKNGRDLQQVRRLHEEAGGGRNPSRPPPIRGADLGRRHGRARDRVVVGAEVNRARVPRVEEQVEVRLDGAAGVRREQDVVRVHGVIGVLGLQEAVVEFLEGLWIRRRFFLCRPHPNGAPRPRR